MNEFQEITHRKRKVLLKNNIRCTPNSGDVIKALLKDEDKLVSQQEIIRRVWGETYPFNISSKTLLRNHINKARDFLSECESCYEICSVFSRSDTRGYMLVKLETN